MREKEKEEKWYIGIKSTTHKNENPTTIVIVVNRMFCLHSNRNSNMQTLTPVHFKTIKSFLNLLAHVAFIGFNIGVEDASKSAPLQTKCKIYFETNDSQSIYIFGNIQTEHSLSLQCFTRYYAVFNTVLFSIYSLFLRHFIRKALDWISHSVLPIRMTQN